MGLSHKQIPTILDSAYITINVKKRECRGYFTPVTCVFLFHACPPEQVLDKRSYPVSNFTW
ncbi:UNVERIFIED_CONTAM: hypothetical protein ABIC26_004194 [Paenibacillus sp. PvR008]